MQILKTKKTFKKELKRQVRYAITAAIGFLIAYSWRNTLIIYSEKLTTNLITKESFLFPLSSSIIVSILGVILIIISARLLQEK